MTLFTPMLISKGNLLFIKFSVKKRMIIINLLLAKKLIKPRLNFAISILVIDAKCVFKLINRQRYTAIIS